MGWWKTAKPGDRIVCVKLPKKRRGPPPSSELVLGRVYVVLDICKVSWFRTGIGIVIGHDHCCGAHLFRPVQPLRNRTETGMALIRTALNTESDKTPVPVKENV